MRFLLVPIMLFFMLADMTAAKTPITAEEFLQKSGLNVDQQVLLSGEIISAGRSEVKINTIIDVAMLVFIPAALPVTVTELQRQSVESDNPSVLAVKEITDHRNAAGELRAFQAVGFDESERREVDRLMKIKPGDSYNLSGKEIEMFQRAAEKVRAAGGSHRSAVVAMGDTMRIVLANRFSAYRSQGMQALAPYQRSRSLQVSPADELIAATESMAILKQYFPQFYRCLRHFPDRCDEKIVHQIFWVKQQQDKCTLFVLKHWLSDIDPGYALIVERQYYLTHTLNSLQVGILCLPYRSGTLVALLNQAFTEKMDVKVGKTIAQRVGRQQVEKQIRPLFENLRTALSN